jgi:excisionase family DNA binding protein
MNAERLVSINEFASRLGFSRRQIYRLQHRQEIPPPVKIGRVVRWPESEIAAFIERKMGERKQLAAGS